MIKAISRAVKKLALKYFSPYTIEIIDVFGDVEVHHSWTRSDAMEWVACALREDVVDVWCVNSPFTTKLVAQRFPVTEA